MKKCPFCAEEIQDEAIVCRYCGRDLLSHVPTKTMTGSEKKVLEKWGVLQPGDEKETVEKKSYIARLLKDAFNFTILAFVISFVSFLAEHIQGRLNTSEFWGLLLSPVWIFWFIVGIPISWVWRKSSERFGKPLSCAIFAFFFFGLSMIGGFVLILMEQR